METLVTLAGYLVGAAWRRRVLLGVIVIGVTGLAVLACLLMRPTYRASTLLVPNTSGSGLNAAFGELSGLAGQFGFDLGTGEDPARLFPSILTSRALAREILATEVHPVDEAAMSYLARFPDRGDDPAAHLEAATKIFLRDRSRVILDPKNSTVKIVVFDRDPFVAAEVANAMAKTLVRINREISRGNAVAKRSFVEERLRDVRKDLARDEEALKTFRESNRSIQDSPQLQLELERLQRQLRIDEEVFLTLTRELELAKIDEVREALVINVLDEAVPPVKPHSPRKTLVVASAFFLSLVLGLVTITAWEDRAAFRRGFRSKAMPPSVVDA